MLFGLKGPDLTVVPGLTNDRWQFTCSRQEYDGIDCPPVAGSSIVTIYDIDRDEENEFLSGGITEDIISALMGVERLRVADRSSVRFKGMAPEVREVGRRLNVDATLEGSVQRAGERLRGTATLAAVQG